MAFTSMLECADGSLYVGSTVDLDRRLSQLSAGEGATYTRTRRPVRLVRSHEQESIREAYFLEKQIQNWSRAKRLALIEGRFADLPAWARSKTPPPI